jgi:hypothetical protein
MSVLPVGMAGASGIYSITNSVRLNGTSDYLSKTLTTSATTSGSVWVKRSKLGATSPIFDNKVYFTSGDALYAFGLTSTALYRDPSAWMHIFWNGTGVYVNGTLVTGSGTYTAASVTNPRLGYDGTNYFSGYLSDFAFWNGTSASPQGGATDANGVWAARRPSAGYSFLSFGSSGALGTDTSGNGNTWTVNGSPVQTTDTPTCNYATWNPIIPASWSQTPPALSSGNTTASCGASWAICMSTVKIPTTGVYVVEFAATTVNSPYTWIGISSGDHTNANYNYIRAYLPNATKRSDVTTSSYGASFTNGDVIGVVVDATNGTIAFYKNGVSQGVAFSDLNSAMPAAGWVFYAEFYSSALTANFGATAMAYTYGSAKPLCTANLTSTAVTTSGTFTGNANADGPFVWTNGNPATLTINGNAVTFGTHADKTAGGFKLRSSSASYNTSGSNTWTATAGKRFVYSATSINTAQGNP